MSKDILISIEFEGKFADLPLPKRKIVEQKIQYLACNRSHPSLNVHRVHRATGSKDIYECYIDKAMRLLFDDDKQNLRLYDLGGHGIVDKIHYRRFDNMYFMRWNTLLKVSEAELAVKDSVPSEIYQWTLEDAKNESADGTFNPFSYFHPSRLRVLGIPQHLVENVRNATNLDEIEHIPGLPETVRTRLLDMATSSQLENVLLNPDRLLFRTTLDRLYDYCEGKIKKLMLNLEQDQREYVTAKRTPLFLLKGVAGSGKTTIGIYRAIELAAQGRRVLLVTFNNTLSRVTQTLVEELIGPVPENLEINTLHSVMMRLLSIKPRLPETTGISKETYPEDFVRDALVEVRNQSTSEVLKRDARFFIEEIKRVIKGLGINSLEDYKKVERYGRESALGPKQREVVWKVYEAYQRRLLEVNRQDWSDVALLMLAQLEAGPSTRKYDDIIVDETQDLVPVDIKVIQGLATSQINTTDFGAVMLLGDAAQTLYSRGFSWKQAGVQARGRTSILKKSHRNTRQIAEAAAQLLKQNIIMRSSNEYIDPEWTSRYGPLPEVLRTNAAYNRIQNELNQIKLVKERILDLVSGQSYRPSDFAILCVSNNRCLAVKRELEEAGLRAAISKDNDFNVLEEQIKVLTIHSAKGLEFPVVFLLGMVEGELPALYRINNMDAEEQQIEIEKERTLCYVGMTRAAHELYLVTTQGCESRFIHELSGKIIL